MASKIFLNTIKFPTSNKQILKTTSEIKSSDYTSYYKNGYGNANYYIADSNDSFFEVVNNKGSWLSSELFYCFVPDSTGFVSNNSFAKNTTAKTILTAQQNFTYLSFDYAYGGDSSDKFTITIKNGENVVIRTIKPTLAPGKKTGTCTIGTLSTLSDPDTNLVDPKDPVLKIGGVIEFYYEKNSSNTDKCYFSNIYGEWLEEDPNSSIKSIKNMYIGVNDVNKVVKRAYVGVVNKNANGTPIINADGTLSTTPKLFFTQLPLRVTSSVKINDSDPDPKLSPLSTARHDLCATTSSHIDADDNLVHQAWFGAGMTSGSSTLMYYYKVERYDKDLTLHNAQNFICDKGSGGGGYCTAVSTGKHVLFLGGLSGGHTIHRFNASSGTNTTHTGNVTVANPTINTRGGAIALKNNRVFFGGGNLGTSIYRLDCSVDTVSSASMITPPTNISYSLVGETVAAAIADEYAIFCTTGTTKSSDNTTYSTLVSIDYEGTVISSKANGNNKLYASLISFDGKNSALFIGSDKDTLKSDGFTINYDLTSSSTILTSNTPHAYGAGTRLGNHILIAGGISGEEDVSNNTNLKQEKLCQSIDVYNDENFILETSKTESTLSLARAHLAATTLTTEDYGDCAIFAGGYSNKTITKSNGTVNSITNESAVDVFTIRTIDNYTT